MIASSKRVTLDMNVGGVIDVLTDGNPGAVVVCMQLLRHGGRIDPANLMGGVMHLLLLDEMQIHGPRIWMLYKDLCGEKIDRVIGMVRAVQLGLMTKEDLNDWIDNARVHNCDVGPMVDQVRKELPSLVVE